ncbi:MAG: alpha/beta fold hydrolase [Dehalococcoidia bacterium]
MRPRVLLLHGFMSGGVAWRQVAAELDADCDLRAPDLLGHGSGPDDHPTLERMVAHVLPVAQAFAPTHIVGHSMGAIVALDLITQLDVCPAGLGLVGLPVYADREDGLSHLHKRGLLHKTVLANDKLSHGIGCRTVYGLRRFWSPVGRAFVPLQPTDHMIAAFQHTRQGHDSINRIVFGDHVPRLADAVHLPIAALHGGRDPSARLDRVLALAQERGWPVHIAPTGTHQLPIERPKMVARWIRDQVLTPPACRHGALRAPLA